MDLAIQVLALLGELLPLSLKVTVFDLLLLKPLFPLSVKST